VSNNHQGVTPHAVVSRNDTDSREEQTMNAHKIEGAVAQKVYATARSPEALRALRDERLVPLGST
jgi:hypothetical protein